MNTTIRHMALSLSFFIPSWPLPIWMIVITLLLGLIGGLGTEDLIRQFNNGFGWALGEFVLILLPSFILAAALQQRKIGAAQGVAVGVAPLVGAGMVCPDTAYAALSPIAGARRLDVAFGAYAGFKLLFPAGPLIVATGLGISDPSLFIYALGLMLPVWAVGVFWARVRSVTKEPHFTNSPEGGSVLAIVFALSPFLLLAFLLMLGWICNFSGYRYLDFITQPKGALIIAAIFALLGLSRESCRQCLDSAIRRTSSLLLLLGVASAFGAILTAVIPVQSILPSGSGLSSVIGFFVLSMFFKLIQGSSMATFAAITPIAAPLLSSMEVSPTAVILAICMGSFVAILPNDSFYWLVRNDILTKSSEARLLATLSIGTLLQASVGLAIILLAIA